MPLSTGRPRDPSLDDAILRAAREQLAADGAAGFTVDAVAKAAGTTKPAVYRRWASKAELIVAAVASMSAPPVIPDTGSLRDDLLACTLRYADLDEGAARILSSVLAEASRDPALREAAFESLGRPPAAAIATVLRRGVERGDLPAGAPIELAAGVVPAVAFRSVMARGRPLDAETITDLVDRIVLPALRAD
jgi:AcrR family transcriptional regulator